MVYSTRRFVLSLALWYFVIVFFSPFSIAITSLGEERAYVSVLYVCSVCACLVYVCFLFLFVSVIGCSLWLWHTLDFTLTFFLNLPFILQVGLTLLHFLSDLHVRVVDAEIVYPVLQLNVAND